MRGKIQLINPASYCVCVQRALNEKVAKQEKL